MTNKEIIDYWTNLTQAKKDFLYKYIIAQKRIAAREVTQTTNDNDENINKPVVCPHCSSLFVVKFGSYRGKARYRCKQCQKSFNLSTGSEMAGSKKADKFHDFLYMLVNRVSVIESARRIGVQDLTIFLWRKKILAAFNHPKSLKEDEPT